MTEEYQVIVTQDAEDDLNALDDYITNVLFAPGTAVTYINTIKEKLLFLTYSPKRYRVVDDEPWQSRGIRRMNAKGFAVFYLINEVFHEVYVLNVIYQKRDIQHIIQEL